jgi:hypothetical protein
MAINTKKTFFCDIMFFSEGGFLCLESERKSDHIMTFRIGRLSRNPEEACNKHLFFDDKAVKKTTIISRGKNATSCRVLKFLQHSLLSTQAQSTSAPGVLWWASTCSTTLLPAEPLRTATASVRAGWAMTSSCLVARESQSFSFREQTETGVRRRRRRKRSLLLSSVKVGSSNLNLRNGIKLNVGKECRDLNNARRNGKADLVWAEGEAKRKLFLLQHPTSPRVWTDFILGFKAVETGSICVFQADPTVIHVVFY